MPPGILSSNLITVPVLDSLLASQAGQEHTYRLQLLSTKLAILTNRPSQPIKRSFDAELQILQCRLELAKVAVRLTNLRLASGELGIVETDCKGMFKRIAREIRARSDREARKSIGQERDVGTASPQQGGGEGEGDGSYTGPGPTIESDVMERPSIQTLTPAHLESSPTSMPTYDPTNTSPDLDQDPESESRTTSHSSLPSVSLSSTSSADAKIAKYQNRQGVITNLRIEALRLLGEVEDLQGRPERRGRWDSLALKLEAG